ncbi:MAG TPA: hypothetical protein PKY08_01755 [Candidatus Magasanikbacteria bacterium]|nr:hypothetical protein [Candidatus Magasanikbacteria bacterium]
MRRFIFFFFITAACLVLGGAGCIQVGGSGNQNVVDGGIFKSVDKSVTWGQATQIFSVGGEKKDFSKEAVTGLVFDPSDHNALYLTGLNTGLLFSYNAGSGWQRPEQIKAGTVSGVAVDYKNKCLIYITLGKLILKTEDCGRIFTPVYQEGRTEASLGQIVTDPFSSSVLYAGNSVGDFLKSSDGGKTWIVIKRFENPLAKIIINPTNSKIIYVATQERGLYRSGDAGISWTDMNEGLKKYGGAYVYQDLVLIDAKSESFLLASQYGLIKTGDGGVTWEALNLLTPPNGAEIKVVTVNPKNSKEIFYATASTFYKSVDGGVQWQTQKLPSTRPPTFLIIDPIDPKIMYFGFGQSIKK